MVYIVVVARSGSQGDKHRINNVMRDLAALQIAERVWLIESDFTVEMVRDLLKKATDNASYFVARIDEKSASWQQYTHIVEWLRLPTRKW
jgi:hypothetical protein